MNASKLQSSESGVGDGRTKVERWPKHMQRNFTTAKSG